MKKEYIKPALQLTAVSCETMIAESLAIQSDTTVNEMYVKEDDYSTGSRGGSVWDDAWN